MNVDDDLGFAQLFGEAQVVAAQLGILIADGITLGLRTTLLRSESLRDSGLPFAPPSREQRRVQSFAPEQRSDATRAFGLIGLGEDALLVLSGKAAALGLGHDFGIGVASYAAGGTGTL